MSLEKDLLEIKTQAKIMLQIAQNYEDFSSKTIADIMKDKAIKILKTID